ncbi:GTP-binding protein Rit1-like [Haliotis asinina]|uniref:GTP-binding protein Rit1-like n=1 Tax=Haliotis asinina TaxID=109174 RepID=UPI00353237E5
MKLPTSTVMQQEQLLHVLPERVSASAPHSRSCSFKNRPRPKLELDLADARPRINSMPNCSVYLSLPDGLHGDLRMFGQNAGFFRVRSFKTTSKGVVNHGDSFKKRSTVSLMSSGSTVTENEQRQRTLSVASEESTAVSGGSSAAPSYFRVVMLGAPGVGKTTLTRQFMTSEYMGSYDVITPDPDEHDDSIVSVMLDGEESMMEFIDNPEDCDFEDLRVDAYVVAFSITDHESFETAVNMVRQLRVEMGTDRAIILVANKTDLVRQRRVPSAEAKVIAMKYDCKYAETSVAINHHVDELLVGILSQIRFKLNIPVNQVVLTEKPKEKLSPKRAMLFLSKLFKQASRKSKSCDNLFV